MLWRLLFGHRTRRAYRRCLANIARLERALFPDRFCDPEPDEFACYPGARWEVDSSNYVMVMPSAYAAAADYMRNYATLVTL